ncbi:MAG: MFS transporter [Candidatus Riflebacteria bacterium]|nr:MFS transporter [Candidatus Riflebacteria bacterium]
MTETLTTSSPRSDRSWRHIAEFLGLKKSIVGVLAMCILIGIGEKMAERFLPIYLVALGSGPIVVGLLNALQNLLSALYSFPGGWLVGRIGTKRALMIFNIVAMIGYLIVLAVPKPWAVLLGALFFISWSALSLPATMNLISEVLPKQKRTMGVSVHSLIRRVPMALGPVIGGALITWYGKINGVWLAFVAALVMAVVSLIFQQVMIHETSSKKEQALNDSNSEKRNQPLISAHLWKLLLADIMVRFCEQIPYPFVVIWCMEMNNISGVDFGLLTAIEMVTAVLIYIPVAWFADRSGKKPFVVMTFVFFTLFPLTLLFCRSFWPLVIAFILRGLKEFGEPTRKALILDLAPEGRKAETFGRYYLYRDIVVSVGAFSGALLWMISPKANLLTASAFGLLGTLWFLWKGEDEPTLSS